MFPYSGGELLPYPAGGELPYPPGGDPYTPGVSGVDVFRTEPPVLSVHQKQDSNQHMMY